MTEIEAVMEALHRLRDRIAENIVGEGAYATGKTTASMEVEQTADGGRLLGRHDFANLESGSPPGNFPGARQIREWLVAKGLKTANDPDLERAVNAINWRIYQEGTVLYRQHGRDTIYTTAIDEMLEELQGQVADIAAERLADGITENLKLRETH